MRKYVLLAVVAAAVVALDQGSKFWVLRELTFAFDGGRQPLAVMYTDAPAAVSDAHHFVPKRSLTLVEQFLRFRYAENPGAAWGLFSNLPQEARIPLFHVVSLGAVLLIGFYFRQLSGDAPAERWALWGLPLVLGGALGNYADRLARGFVIDFIEAHWHDRVAWPSFNVADSAICVGVGMLVLDSIVRREKPRAA